MKFREYGEVKPLTITAETEQDLDKKIEETGEKSDIIDLQFATCYDSDKFTMYYSALLLVRKEV